MIQPSPFPPPRRPLRFPSRAACEAFLDAHNIAAMPINQGTHHIAVVMMARGVFGVSSPTTAELMPDW